MNDVFQNKIEEFIGHQNSLFEKTRTHLLDAKEEYLKLMEFVRGKDYEIEKLANSNDKQKDLIQSLEERLLSIVVLEYKMKNLDLENQKNLDKTKKDYETSLNKFILTHKLSTSSSNKEINEVQKMKEAEKKLAEIKIKELEKNNQAIKNKLAMTIDLRNKSLQEKTQEIKNLKENLSRIKKSKYLLQEPIPKFENEFFIFLNKLKGKLNFKLQLSKTTRV